VGWLAEFSRVCDRRLGARLVAPVQNRDMQRSRIAAVIGAAIATFALGGCGGDKATLATFAGGWQAHARTLKITPAGDGDECHADLCAAPSGGPLNTWTAVVRANQWVGDDAVSKANPPFPPFAAEGDASRRDATATVTAVRIDKLGWASVRKCRLRRRYSARDTGHDESATLQLWRSMVATRMRASTRHRRAKVSRDSVSQVNDYGPIAERREDLEGTAVQFLTANQDLDGTPLMRGRPDDRCSSPHWGTSPSARSRARSTFSSARRTIYRS